MLSAAMAVARCLSCEGGGIRGGGSDLRLEEFWQFFHSGMKIGDEEWAFVWCTGDHGSFLLDTFQLKATNYFNNVIPLLFSGSSCLL